MFVIAILSKLLNQMYNEFKKTADTSFKVVRFNLTPKIAEVTLNSFIFVLDIFCTNVARKCGMINITHDVTFYLLQ